MLINNYTPVTLSAFGWHKSGGFGDDVIILPGESKNVSGPPLSKTGEEIHYLSISGVVTIQENPDDNGYHISKETPLQITSESDPEIGVTITVYCEEEVAE